MGGRPSPPPSWEWMGDPRFPLNGNSPQLHFVSPIMLRRGYPKLGMDGRPQDVQGGQGGPEEVPGIDSQFRRFLRGVSGGSQQYLRCWLWL